MGDTAGKPFGWLRGSVAINGEIVAPNGERNAHFELDIRLIAERAEQLGLRMVVLFGSRAGGDVPAKWDSDVDLAVLPGAVRASLLSVHESLAEVTTTELDLVWLDEADSLFRWEILRAGELLYGDIDDFLEYRAFAFRDFTDSADLRALEAELLNRKLEHLRELDRAG